MSQQSTEPKPNKNMPDGTVYAGISPDSNSLMYTTMADAPLTMTFSEAKKYAAKLDAEDLDELGRRKGWHIPTKTELKVMYNNRAAIGGFSLGSSKPGSDYWTSTPYCDNFG